MFSDCISEKIHMQGYRCGTKVLHYNSVLSHIKASLKKQKNIEASADC